MRYLCFDIECCDGIHICEFGYVITDEKFNIIDKQVILINPDEKFNLIGRVNQKDIILHFSEEEYYASSTFPHFYNEIKDLLGHKDQIIIGHAINNDAKFLNTACKRYLLPSLDFDFFDSQKAYEEYSKYNDISLENAGKELGIEKPVYLHKSDDDAFLTICVVKSLCEHMGASLKELKYLCRESTGVNKNFHSYYLGNSLTDKLNKLAINPDLLDYKNKIKTLLGLSKRVKPKIKIIKSILNGKKLCFSKTFELEHLKETLILIQMLANYGCRYSSKVLENDYYVATEDEMLSENIDKYTRYYAATEIRDDGRKIEVLDFKQLYGMINTTKDELENMKWPDAKFFNISEKTTNKKNITEKTDRTAKKELTTTLGELDSVSFKKILSQLKSEEVG